MPASPVVRLGSITLLGSSNVCWPVTAGVKPTIVDFDVMPKDIKALEAMKGQPQKLSITSRGVKLEVQGLYVLHIGPGDSKNIYRVSVADRRWLWSMAHYIKRLNVRRNVGFQRLKATGVAALEPVAPKIWYAKYSLAENSTDPNVARFRPKEALRRILNYLSKYEKNYNGATFGFTIEDSVGKLLDQLPIENLELDDSADQALNRILNYLPGVGIKCLVDGSIVVYSKADGGDVTAEKNLGPEIAGGGHALLVSNSAIRPKSIKYRFTTKLEFRLDFSEGSTYAGTQTDELGDVRICENVLPVPDYQLTLTTGQVVTQGTYITFDQALAAYNDARNGTLPGIKRLDYDLLQKAFIPWMGLWSALQLTGLRQANADWVSRIAALRQHYRRTFRINPRIMDRAFSVDAVRCATIDPVRGQPAPAVAYTDYAVIPSMKASYTQASGNADLSAVINVAGYPASGLLDSNAKPAQCDVELYDKDQGIIHLNYRLDPAGLGEQILPSMVEINGDNGTPGTIPARCGPTLDLSIKGRTHAFNAVVRSKEWAKLTSQHKAIIVLSVTPASPNDERQLYEVEVKPDDIVGLLPKSLSGGATDAKGPVMEVRIGPGIEVARVVWNDARASDIERALGLNDPNQDGGGPKANLKDLVVNDGDISDTTFGGALKAIAKAHAASVYASLADRPIGEKTGNLSPNISPAGYIDTVTHEIGTDGRGTTHLSFPEQLPKMSLWQFMDAGTRAILMRLVR